MYEGNLIPSTPDSIVPNYRLVENGKFVRDNESIPLPNLIGVKRDAGELSLPRIAFLGNSITQGCSTECDKYEFWSSKIGMSLHKTTSVSVWNL